MLRGKLLPWNFKAFVDTTGDNYRVVQPTIVFRRRLRLRHSPVLLLRLQCCSRRKRRGNGASLHHKRRRRATAVYRSPTEPDRRTHHAMYVAAIGYSQENLTRIPSRI